MKLKSIKFVVFAVFTLSALWFAADAVKADTINTRINIADNTASGSAVVSSGAVETTSEGAINSTSPAITTTPPSITTPGGVETEKKDNTTAVEVFDEFSVGGIFYTVTSIKGDKVYVGVSGIVNDRATTVYIPKKIKYKGKEMTVTSIEEDSFSYLDRLRKVVIAADITYIGNDAFKEANRLGRLIIKASGLKKTGKNIFKDVSERLIIEVPKKSLASYRKLFKNKGMKIKEIRAISK